MTAATDGCIQLVNGLESMPLCSFPRSTQISIRIMTLSTFSWRVHVSGENSRAPCRTRILRGPPSYAQEISLVPFIPRLRNGESHRRPLFWFGSRGYGGGTYVSARNNTSLFTSPDTSILLCCAPLCASALVVLYAPCRQHQQRNPGEIRSAGSTAPSSVNDEIFSAIQVNAPLLMDVPWWCCDAGIVSSSTHFALHVND